MYVYMHYTVKQVERNRAGSLVIALKSEKGQLIHMLVVNRATIKKKNKKTIDTSSHGQEALGGWNQGLKPVVHILVVYLRLIPIYIYILGCFLLPC